MGLPLRFFLPSNQPRIPSLQAVHDPLAVFHAFVQPGFEFQRLPQSLGKKPEEHAEVAVLRDRPPLFVVRAFLVRGFRIRNAEDRRRRRGVNVAAFGIGFHHHRIPAQRRPGPQFKLAVIHAHNPVSLRRPDEVPHADRVAALPRHVLQVRCGAGKPPRIRAQGKEAGMNPPRCAVHIVQIPVDIGAGNLAPFSVTLHQFKQPAQLRLVNVAPFFQLDHHRVVHRFFVAFRQSENRQL